LKKAATTGEKEQAAGRAQELSGEVSRIRKEEEGIR